MPIHPSRFCFFSHRFVFPTTRLGPESQFSDFLDGLGPAQIVGRQTLATPPMGKSEGEHYHQLFLYSPPHSHVVVIQI